MIVNRAETDFWCANAPAPAFYDDGDGGGDLAWRSRLASDFGNESCVVWNGTFDTKEELEAAVEANRTRKCTEFEYDRSFWRRTIVQEWDLVCDREYMQKWTQQVTFFGLLVGVIVSGIISDRYTYTQVLLSFTFLMYHVRRCIICIAFK